MQLEIFDELADTDFVSQDAKGRYKIFKEYIGKYWFYECLFPYLRLALREDDIHSITAAIQELDAIRKHELLTNPISRGRLYVRAKSYIVYMVETERLHDDCDDLTLVLMLIILHENNYFDTFFLPHEAFTPFEFDGIAPHLQIVGEVYGRYFMFYDYLQGKLKECESTLENTATERTDKSGDDKKAPVLTFKDTFLIIHKDKFDAIIESLGKLLPDTILNKYEELKRLDGPIIYEKEKGYALNGLLPRQPSYLAGLYRVCLKNGWVGKQHSLETIKDALALTFTTELNTLTAFKKALSQDHVPKYSEPFRMLFETIK